MKNLVILSIITLLTFVNCSQGSLLPTITGSAFEVLIVIDEKDWRTDGGKAVFETFDQDVPHLPQAEQAFKISRVPFKSFDAQVRPARNIFLMQVDPSKYTQISIKYLNNRWSKPQAVISVTAPSMDDVRAFMEANHKEIVSFFVDAERNRMIDYIKENRSREVYEAVYKQFGCQILVPSNVNKLVQYDDFLLASNYSPTVRQDIVVYSYPYTSVDQLTEKALLAKRDEIFKKYVSGATEGSYVGTEYKYEPPVMRNVSRSSEYRTEITGLWKMYNGDAMGGPFVSHTRIDEINNRVVTVEGFVFAPGKPKRNPIKQLEAALYTLRMPQEVNQVIVKKVNDK